MQTASSETSLSGNSSLRKRARTSESNSGWKSPKAIKIIRVYLSNGEFPRWQLRRTTTRTPNPLRGVLNFSGRSGFSGGGDTIETLSDLWKAAEFRRQRDGNHRARRVRGQPGGPCPRDGP